MTEIAARYQIGVKVFHSGVRQLRTPVVCPDCKDTRKWKAESPAGETFEFDCPRCGWQHNSPPVVTEWKPVITELTIGSVRYDSNPYDGSDRFQYMCDETGVGSGQIYNESKLFPDSVLAERAALLECMTRSNEPACRTRYNAQRLAATSTMRTLTLDAEIAARRKFQYQAEDAARIVFDESRSDAECRSELKVLLEVVG
jgi:hypothetical protein